METKGDVYAAQGKSQEALKNYGQALEKCLKILSVVNWFK